MTMPDSFLFDDTVVEIIRTPRRKTLSIEVGHNGVKARAPMRMKHAAIVDFIISKRDWIKRHIAGLPPTKPPLALGAGTEIMFQGTNFSLSIVHGSTKPCYLALSSIVVPIKRSHLPLEQSVGNKLVRWYKSIAHEELRRKVARYAVEMNVHPSKSLSIKVRDYKRRWGSCDSKGALSFNWRIIQAPSEVLDYVVVHELAHCHEFNHSKRFWKIVEKQMPNWKNQQLWLQTHGADLYRINIG